MAIFDSEKRPRGLRVPSLTAMKNNSAASISQFSFHGKKSEPRTPDEDPTPTQDTAAVYPAPPPPPKAAPSPSKQLPAIPKDQLPPRPRASPMVPQRRQVGSNARTNEGSTPPQGLRRPAAPPGIEIASPVVDASPQSQLSPAPLAPASASAASIPASDSATLTPSRGVDGDGLTPLEDFIPTPDGTGTPLEPVSSDERASPYTPPLDFEPIPAPLDKLHYACFQEHRNMPMAQNVYCPVPCMTCHKFDREIRYRCVFCCLRVCESCHQTLMKCKDRSLAELMASLRRV